MPQKTSQKEKDENLWEEVLWECLCDKEVRKIGIVRVLFIISGSEGFRKNETPKEDRLPEDVTHKEEYEKEEKSDLSDGQWAVMQSIRSHVEEYKEVEVRKETEKI